MKLRFGVHLPTHGMYSYHSVLTIALLAERLGFESLWVGDHFFLPAKVYEKIGVDSDRPNKLDAWVTLTALAAQTKRIILGARVSPIPFYLPGRLAKIVATLDIVSGGRVILGAGAAWYREEAVSYGIGWDRLQKRIEKMLEGLDVIMSLWKSDRTNYEGKYYRIKSAPFYPKPVQKPHPPIWFGGSSPGILEAVAKIGEGWLPSTDTPPEAFKRLASKIMQLAKKNHREPSEITLTPALSFPTGIGKKPEQWVEGVENLVEGGAQHVLIDFSQTPVPPERAMEFLRFFANKVFSLYRSAL